MRYGIVLVLVLLAGCETPEECRDRVVAEEVKNYKGLREPKLNFAGDLMECTPEGALSFGAVHCIDFRGRDAGL